MKYINLLWGLSLLTAGLTGVLVVASNLLGISLPDTAVRVMGILDLIALPVLAFTTVKKLNSRDHI